MFHHPSGQELITIGLLNHPRGKLEQVRMLPMEKAIPIIWMWCLKMTMRMIVKRTTSN